MKEQFDTFDDLFNTALENESIEPPKTKAHRAALREFYRHAFYEWLESEKLEFDNKKTYTSQLTRSNWLLFLGFLDKNKLQNEKQIELEKTKWQRESVKPTTTNPIAADPSNSLSFQNNFDHIDMREVYKHFYAGLVEKKYLTKEELDNYLKIAFERTDKPKLRFKLKDISSKQKVQKVFYDYYKNIAGKPHGKMTRYAALLGDYFEGFNTNTLRTNFNK